MLWVVCKIVSLSRSSNSPNCWPAVKVSVPKALFVTGTWKHPLLSKEIRLSLGMRQVVSCSGISDMPCMLVTSEEFRIVIRLMFSVTDKVSKAVCPVSTSMLLVTQHFLGLSKAIFCWWLLALKVR